MAAPIWPVAMVTGHRPQHLAEPGAIEWVADELKRIAAKLVQEHGTRMLISGLALGADMLWANAAVRTGASLWAHIPFPQQTDVWDDPELKRQWARLRDYAKKSGDVTYYGDLGDLAGPERKRMAIKLLHARNGGMVAETTAAGGVCVAVLRSSKLDGGTRDAFDKALRAGVPVIHVDPDRRTVTLPRPKTSTTPNREQEALPL